MSRKILILACSLIILCGCSARGKKRSAAKNKGAVIETPAAATSPKRKYDGSVVALRPGARPEKPIVILPSEVVHVSITRYDPFGDYELIEIDLGELAQYFCYPYPGNVTSRYGVRNGSMHTGLDIKVPANDTIRCILPGVVRMSKFYSDYGNIVVVRHYNGLESVYSHNSKNLVEVNDVVRSGAPLALAGRTGRATGDHLHLELRVMGQHFDPELILDTQNGCLFTKETLYLSRPDGKLLAETSAREKTVYPQLQLSSVKKESKNKATDKKSANKRSSHKTYTIQRGDTLYSISRRHGLTVQEICRLNNIASSSTIYPGQRIRIR